MCSVAGEMLASYRAPGYDRLCRCVGGTTSANSTSASNRSQLGARPCLVVPAPHLSRPKKKVVFADDRGFSLIQVRMVREPSNVPPPRPFSILTEEENWDSGEERWEMCFAQPASDYIEFKRRLDRDNVSLENVFIKEREGVAFGTVKVRNLAFEKNVVIRATFDDWKNRDEIGCNYVQNGLGSSTGVTLLYDTFSFQIPLASVKEAVEFCVCYRSTGLEFWDNNAGKNYRLLRKGADPLGYTPRTEIPVDRLTKREPRLTNYSEWPTVPYW